MNGVPDFPKKCAKCGGTVGYEDYEPDLCYGCFIEQRELEL